MKLDGVDYHVYTLHVLDREIVGVDRRPIAEVEAEWLAKNAVAARRESQAQRALLAANLRNEALIQRKLPEERDPAYQSEPDPIAPDEVTPPPAVHAESDEVLRLAGVPGGLGAVSVLARDVHVIQLAFGEDLWDVEDTIEDREQQVARAARKAAGKRNRATTRRRGK